MRVYTILLRIFLILFIATGWGGEKVRIVTLGPYATENLSLLGLEKNIVGLTVYDKEERKKGKEIIGTLWEPNIEKIVSLKPDAVIVSKEGNKPGVVKKLEKFGIKVYVLGELHNFNDICRNFLYLGKIFKKEKEAEEIIKREKEKLNKLKKKIKGRKNIFFILGFNPLFTMGKTSYINDIVELAGGKNIFSEVRKKYFPVSMEEVIRKNPEVIIYLKMEEEQKYFWERIKDVDAVKNKRVYSLLPYIFASPTPESFVKGVEIINHLLYSEKYENRN